MTSLVPASIKAKVPALAQLIAELRAHVSTVKVTSKVEGAQVIVRKVPVGKTPLPPLRVNAGEAIIEGTSTGTSPS